MPRARNLKPGLFKNDELAETGPLGMLLFAGLWTVADREGRLEDRPLRIKAEVLPYFDADTDALLWELDKRGFIKRYESSGKRFIQVVRFVDHQQPHYKEIASVIPPPPGHVDSPYVTFGVPSDQRQRILERDGLRCVECGASEDLTMDHVVARSKGGSGDDDNLRTLCRRCNSSKNNRDAASTSAQRRLNVGSSKSPDDLLTPDSGYLTPDVLIPDTGGSGGGSEPSPDEQAADAAQTEISPDEPQEPTNGETDALPGTDDAPPSSEAPSPAQPVPKPVPKPERDPPGFPVFWLAYPNKTDRKAAVEQWRRLKPNGELQGVILAAIEAQKRSRKWQEGFVKAPNRWLRDRNWEDEVETEPMPIRGLDPEKYKGGKHLAVRGMT